ncbi:MULTISPECIES: M23 family metallopeptidase [Bacillus cereus group]|nr:MULTISPECIES: M23 family metallopeptidase [Bacillus cereus group]PEW14821.1 peptidase M23 [Bacillus cereus]PFD11048.1 peptidase M23 [Bacillus cereus]PFD40728.1 peptidase M23 [Bacillus cereus]PFH86072.1 peptidase M23 [Bacillus cereus]PFV32123.1 peptidase M23 [Bacillus thuringiensis]
MTKFIYPTDTTRVTSGFRGSRPDHHGVDLAEAGYHPIYAAASGQVSRSYFSSSYGECIMIVHTIDGITWETVYAHMRSGSRTVKEGDYVSQGQTIGVMGNTGDSSGQHLHFELHKGRWNASKSNAVNPLAHLGKDGGGNNTDKPIQPVGLGIAVNKYPNNGGINLYSQPQGGHFTRVIYDKTPYLIIDAAWYENPMICLGNEAWAALEHFDVQWFSAYSKYPPGGGINTYDGPNGNYTGFVDGSVPYRVFGRLNGYIDIGNNAWVKEEHFNVR